MVYQQQVLYKETGKQFNLSQQDHIPAIVELIKNTHTRQNRGKGNFMHTG